MHIKISFSRWVGCATSVVIKKRVANLSCKACRCNAHLFFARTGLLFAHNQPFVIFTHDHPTLPRMLQKRLLILYLLVINLPAFAQLDSLLNLLKTHTADDTTKAGYYSKISRMLAFSNPETGLLYADSSIALAMKLNAGLRLGNGYSVKGINLSNMGNDSAAIRFYKLAKTTLVRAGNDEGLIALVTQNEGISYFNISNYANAISCHQKALELGRKVGNVKVQSAALNSLGVVYMTLNMIPKAMENYFASLKIVEEAGDSLQMATTYTNLGIQHKNIGNYEKALWYYQKAFGIYNRKKDALAVAKTYGNLGVLYSSMGNNKRSVVYYNQALEINMEANNTFGWASNLTNIAISEQALGQYADAYNNFMAGLEKYLQINDVSNTAFSYQKLGDLLLNTPLNAVLPLKQSGNRNALAVEYLNKALSLYQSLEDVAGMGDVCESLSQAYTNTNQPAKALDSYKEFIMYRDSINSYDNKLVVAQKELEYSFDKKEAQVKSETEKQRALAQAEVDKQRIKSNAIMGGVALLAVSGIGGFISYKRRRDTERKRIESDHKLQVTDTEMKALRAQMNPHFIFNSLNSISDYINKNDVKAADDYLSKFAKLMRQILENSEMKEVALKDDLKALENYMHLEAMRMQNKFTYNITVDDNVDTENTLVPPLILQPFVENSIWHGIANKQGTANIQIKIAKEGDMINCMVEDNGVGRIINGHATVMDTKKSMGMKITQSRIDILNRVKKTAAGIQLTDLSEGLRVEVRLPYINSF